MTIAEQVAVRTYPPFSLYNLIEGTFKPKAGQKICILIELDDPRDVVGFKFLENPDLSSSGTPTSTFIWACRKVC